MAYEDQSDAYQDFQDLFSDYENATDVDMSYVKDGLVNLCSTADVNKFGATFIPVFYYANFLLSLLGNALVLCIIYKYEKLNTVTNIFLLNLVISDLLFASSLPFWATYHSGQWIFGTAMCKIVGSAYVVGFNSSILFLTLMTFDRYLAVVHAVTALRSRRRAYAFVSTAAVWCVSVLASVKEMVLYDVTTHVTYGDMCEETGYSQSTMTRWTLIGYYQQFVFFFLLPLLMLLYCYTRITVRIMSTRMTDKCRAVKLIFVIVFTFFVCWTPYNVVVLLRALKISRAAAAGAAAAEECSSSLDYAVYVTRNVAYLYCCVSPVFYTFVGKKFQSHFRKLLSKHVPCLRGTLLVSQSSKSTTQRSPYSNSDY